MKKFIALLMAVMMILTLAACGSEKPAEQPTEAPTQAPTQGSNPSTGDNGIVMFTTLLFVAMFGIVATVAFGKKHA